MRVYGGTRGFPATAVILLSLISTSLSSDDLTYIGKHLCVSYKVVENQGSSVKTEVVLWNTGTEAIAAGNWSLYHCSVRMITGLDKQDNITISHSGFRAFHINGCLFKFVPEAEFSTLAAGARTTLEIQVNDWMVARTDVMPNWYVADDNNNSQVITCTQGESLAFVEPFTTPQQWKRTADDQYNPYTPWERFSIFDKYQGSDADYDPARDVIPYPASVDFSGHIEFRASDWVVLNNSDIYAEVLLTSETLGVRIVDATPSTKFIELALSTQIPTIPCSGEEELHRIRTTAGEGTPEKIHLEAVTSTGLFYGVQTLRMLTKRGTLPLGTLTDCARYSYRGVMIDVGRNFHSKDSVLALIRAMGTYKLNKLHLHLTDDEGWRLEIPGLPELTQVGATRCHDSDVCILPQLGSSPAGGDQGSGYYSVADYKEILSVANSHHIQVIPEFDVPGHAHAAIKAMEARAAGGDHSFLLNDPDDTSKYLSVQMFTDNAINPCIESTYTFMRHIVQKVKEMHQEIQPLSIFHFGGDEVATTAWTGSPKCAGQSKVELKRNFTQRLSQDVAEAGLSLAAWEDGVADETSEPYEINLLATDDVTAYAWSNIWEWGQGDRAYRLANAGYKVVLSHASHLYFDHPSEPDPEERGYYWAPRYTDTAKTFSYSPVDIYSNILTDRMGNTLTKEGVCATHSCVTLNSPENIIGMQAQLWTETVRTREEMEQMLWPRMLAVAERAWYKAPWEDVTDDVNARATQLASNWTEFARAVAEIHLPILEDLGLNYSVRPPGVRLTDRNSFDALTEFPGMPVVFQLGESSEWIKLEPGHEFGPEVSVKLAAQSFDRSSTSRSVEMTTNGSSLTRASFGTFLCFLLCVAYNLF